MYLREIYKVKISGWPWILQNRLNFQRYLLVQISEAMKGKPRQILPVAGENSYKPQYKTVDSYVYDGVKAIANKALDAFDSLNKNNVPLPNIPPPNLGSLGGGSNTGTNSGNSGNSGWRVWWTRKCWQGRKSLHIIQELQIIFALTYCNDSISFKYFFNWI